MMYKYILRALAVESFVANRSKKSFL